MTLEDNLTFCVDESDVWYTLDTVFLICSALAVPDVVVLDLHPLIFLHVVLQLGQFLVDGETHESDLVTPVSASSFEHFLVMGHWTLAWWAPGSPKIEQKNLTRLVLDSSQAFAHFLSNADLLSFLNFVHLVTNSEHAIDFDLLLPDSSADRINVIRDRLSHILLLF